MDELKLCPFCGGERRYIFDQVDRDLLIKPEAICGLVEFDGEHLLEFSIWSELWNTSFAKPVNFCPMCGRDLRKEKA